ncbi:MAG TPA: PQQ-binding-like beta-propeller repeat protein [Candidatus Bathyarchaeia archaeon]|nr:PQQ-binding-like beta-propeller repeat protein [Candidatus Bathyarchaeia archaeon]
MNESTGVIKWNKQISKPVMASPATTKDKVFFAASDKRIYCFRIKDGSSIWVFETGDKIWSSPSLSEKDGIMFFGFPGLSYIWRRYQYRQTKLEISDNEYGGLSSSHCK